LPKLVSNYRLDTSDVGLGGHSAAGVFGASVLLGGAKVFRKLILGSVPISPWEEYWEAAIRRFIASPPAAPISCFMGYGGRAPRDRSIGPSLGAAPAFLTRLAAAAPNLTATIREFPDETHGSVVAHVLASGIRTLWPGKGWSESKAERMSRAN